jgi:prepilin-type N-terminal cleavage/methylation domain-containing protein
MIIMWSQVLNRKQGFTLVEVMIAIAILAVSLISLNSYQAFSVRRATEAQKLTTATMLARKKMAETELEFRNLALNDIKKEDGGNFEGYEGFSWKRAAEEFIIPIPPALQNANSGAGEGEDMMTAQITQKVAEIISKHVMKITLTVDYSVRGKKRQLQVVTHYVDLVSELEVGLL